MTNWSRNWHTETMDAFSLETNDALHRIIAAAEAARATVPHADEDYDLTHARKRADDTILYATRELARRT